MPDTTPCIIAMDDSAKVGEGSLTVILCTLKLFKTLLTFLPQVPQICNSILGPLGAV